MKLALLCVVVVLCIAATAFVAWMLIRAGHPVLAALLFVFGLGGATSIKITDGPTKVCDCSKE